MLRRRATCVRVLFAGGQVLESRSARTRNRATERGEEILRRGGAQVLFAGGKFQWKRLENLIRLAREGSGGLDLSDTVASGARVILLDERLRSQLLMALTEDNRLHVDVRALPPLATPDVTLCSNFLPCGICIKVACGVCHLAPCLISRSPLHSHACQKQPLFPSSLTAKGPHHRLS